PYRKKHRRFGVRSVRYRGCNSTSRRNCTGAKSQPRTGLRSPGDASPVRRLILQRSFALLQDRRLKLGTLTKSLAPGGLHPQLANRGRGTLEKRFNLYSLHTQTRKRRPRTITVANPKK